MSLGGGATCWLWPAVPGGSVYLLTRLVGVGFEAWSCSRMTSPPPWASSLGHLLLLVLPSAWVASYLHHTWEEDN